MREIKIKQGHERESGRARGGQEPPEEVASDLWMEGGPALQDLGNISRKEPKRAHACCASGRATGAHVAAAVGGGEEMKSAKWMEPA